MSHNKSESGGDLLKALCRFVKILPTGLHVTFGSGCIVLKSGPPPSADLITTTQVLTKNDLLGDSSIFIQFLNNKWFQLKLKSQDAANLPDSKPGRVLRDIEGNEDRVSFLRIPVDMFDPRMWITRKIWPMEKLALCCFYPSDENLKTSISKNDITCNVISEDRKDRRFYITEPSYLRFGTDPGEFALLSVSDTDCANPAKTLKNFATEEKPKGAPLLDAKGRLVGMLAVARSGERKVYPVFLPTLTGDSNNHGLGDEKISDADMMSFQNKIFRPETDEKEQHNNHSPKNPVSKEFRNEDKEAQTGTTDRQGSASPSSSPLHESSPEAKLGNGSTQEQHESGSSHRPDNGEETSSGEVESNSSADMANQNQPHDDPSTSSVPEDNSAPKQRTDQEDDEKSSPEETENSSRELEEPHDYASIFEEQDQEGGNTGYGHANNEISIRNEPDGKNKETDPQVDNYADEDVSQTLTGQARISTLATHNSCHDQFSDPDYFHDDEDFPFPTTVTDPTPSEHKRTLQERHSNSQHGMDRTVTMQTGEVATEKEHVYAGSYVEKLILRKELIMDLLSLYLDRSIYPKFGGAPSLAKRWEHLADYCKVDAKIKKQCGISAHLSPSEAMFKYLCQSKESIKVRTLKKNLLEISRKDVHDELENLLDDDNMNHLCDNHPETLLNICLHLDDNRSVRYWYHLGLKIGISGEILRSFKGPSEFSPSNAILEKIATLKPKLPLENVQTVLQEVEKWVPGISNVLSDLAVDSSNTIQTLLDKFEAVEKLTALLDLEERAWMHFGSKLGMERLQLNSLREESPPSPTKLLMKHIVAKKPDLTMSFFLRALKSIERFDVITELEKFFVAKDIADILKGEEDFTQ